METSVARVQALHALQSLFFDARFDRLLTHPEP